VFDGSGNRLGAARESLTLAAFASHKLRVKAPRYKDGVVTIPIDYPGQDAGSWSVTLERENTPGRGALPAGSFYSRFNLHYHAERGVKVAGCVNWIDYPGHAFLPYNTEFRVGPGRSGFTLTTVDSGMQIRFDYASRQMGGMSIPDYLNLIMSPTPVSYDGLSEVDRRGIEAGEARVGMSKEGVKIALGYPPAFRTPSLENNRWTYQRDRRRSRIVEFDDSGKVLRIRG